MSDASTRLADHHRTDHHRSGAKTLKRPSPAGRSALRSGRWQARLWDATPPSVLVDEAAGLTEERRFRRASRVLAVAATTTPVGEGRQRRDILRRLAVTAADGGQHRISGEAMFELQATEPHDADTWAAFANVALARGNHGHADAAARRALAQEPDHHGAWVALAAGYAGLGWFDEAGDCLNRLDRSTMTELDRWRIGRAVNRWALAESRWAIVAAVSALLLGLLALAIAVSVPFAAREWRLRRMRTTEGTKRFESLAVDAWRFERKLRLCHAAAVVTSVAGFIAVMLLF